MTSQRDQYVYDQHHDGRTFSEIGNDLGVTRQRVTQLYNRAQYELEVIPEDPLLTLIYSACNGDHRLASQIRNTLNYFRITTIDDILGLSDYDIRTMRRFGPRSEQIVFDIRELARDNYED